MMSFVSARRSRCFSVPMLVLGCTTVAIMKMLELSVQVSIHPIYFLSCPGSILSSILNSFPGSILSSFLSCPGSILNSFLSSILSRFQAVY